ncbi:putative ABC transporter permease [Anaerobium acetethylicum]|uniref:Uncharacterized membrane protein n=1 Tax=Anaerobium acetethylicum TaxID=1619234 RepID=A0A1D3TP29_9FIRM|nr:putative ABC transporter permease [Anaerobium acetethylicum]SCP95096.1 Uncharacterized membrane protein [Anaerobium acetethylicum]
MWEFKVLGIEIYYILSWFFIYSFFGWVFESSYVSLRHKKLINRGFVTGPFCTIYGCGAVSVYVLLHPFAGNIVFLFLGGCIVATVLEYLTAVVMETMFHTSWWDYSNQTIQFQGRICLTSTLTWGGFTVLLFTVLHPAVEAIVSSYSMESGKFMVSVVVIIFSVDFLNATLNAVGLDKRLKKMNQLIDELYNFLQPTKLFDTKEEFLSKLNSYKKNDVNRGDFRSKLEEKLDLLSEKAKELNIREYKKEIEVKFLDLGSRYLKLRGQKNSVHDRFLRSYPNLKSKVLTSQSQLRILRDRLLRNRK